MDDYKLFQAMFYVLRTGIQRQALPWQPAAHSTAHDRYQEWVKAGVFYQLWHPSDAHNQVEGNPTGVAMHRLCFRQSPPGGQDAGPDPTHRGKGGTKRHILTQARGLPIALTVTGANVHDKKQVKPLPDSMPRCHFA